MSATEPTCRRCRQDGALCATCPLIGMCLLTPEQAARLGVSAIESATAGRWARRNTALIEHHRDALWTLLHPSGAEVGHA